MNYLPEVIIHRTSVVAFFLLKKKNTVNWSGEEGMTEKLFEETDAAL